MPAVVLRSGMRHAAVPGRRFSSATQPEARSGAEAPATRASRRPPAAWAGPPTSVDTANDAKNNTGSTTAMAATRRIVFEGTDAPIDAQGWRHACATRADGRGLRA